MGNERSNVVGRNLNAGVSWDRPPLAHPTGMSEKSTFSHDHGDMRAATLASAEPVMDGKR